MLLNISRITTILTIMLSASGCGSITTLASSIVKQNAGINYRTYSSGNWTFNGLNTKIPPRGRSGFYPTPVSGSKYLEPDKLGAHGYCLNFSEKNGIVYTCSGGHIDIGHVRKMADWTGFLAAKSLEQIEKENTEFKFKLYESSIYFVTLTYPENWENFSEGEKESIAREVSINLGKYLAFSAGTWHEILTWFDYRPKGFKSEFPSAFSWEDEYSNLLGVLLAEKALRNNKIEFSSSITLYLDEALKELNVQSKKTAWLVTEKMKWKWFSKGFLFTKIQMRNFDTGLDDGFVSPCPVPDISVCNDAKIKPLKVPDLKSIDKYGFSVKIEIKPREWEKNKILNFVYPQNGNKAKRIEPVNHFPVIMKYIEDEAKSRGDLILENPK
jgi:hypothetical protein